MSKFRNTSKPNRNNTATKERSYVIGFVSSIALSLIAYSLVVGKLLTGWTLVLTLGGLAIIQCIVQLVLFLDLLEGPRPRWRLGSFFFMLLIALVIVVGSVWVMYSLNTRMMPNEQEMKTYMEDQAGL